MGIGRRYLAALYIAFASSGFSALVYEILWTKYLSLSFGTTIPAISIVAATFMGGLALGSYLIGRHADNQHNLLKLYAMLEVGIAIFALLFPPTLQLSTQVHIYLIRLVPDHPLAVHAIHLIFAGILLVPPTLCMGGTFPLMCRFFARRKAGAQIGRLYALNTLGATLGAFLAGFLLIPSLGLSTTAYIAIFINLAVAALSYHLARHFGQTNPKDVSQASRPEQPLKARRYLLPLAGIGLIGFFSLAYEILWTRVFLLFLGNTTYAFALMLSAFLIGIALGGAIYAHKAHEGLDEKKVFTNLTLLMGIAILATAPFYDRLAILFQFAHDASQERWWHLSLLSFLFVFAVMALPTILSGSLLPATVALIDPGRRRTGEGVGLVVLFNTVGAMLGSLAAGFGLIPSLGLLDSFRLLGVLNVLLGCLFLLRFQRQSRAVKIVPVAVGALLLVVLLPGSWNQKLLNSGVYCYAPAYKNAGGVDKALATDRIIEVIEGVESTVAVKESPDGSIRFLSVNGKTDASNGVDLTTQHLIAQLPMLLHPDPQETLVIGLGSGITTASVRTHAPRTLDCIEISPGVVRAARHFKRSNDDILQSQGVNLVIEDGRNWLLTQERGYDVIVSQPSNPWQSGNANLFTREFYELGARHLKQGGIFCQWLGLYDITPANLKIAGNTFLQSFAHVLAFSSGPDLILIGSAEPLKFDYRTMKRTMQQPAIRSALARIGIRTPGELIGRHFLFSDQTLRSFSQGAPMNTDDHPILEFSYRYNLGGKTFGRLERLNRSALSRAQQGFSLPLENAGDAPQEIASSLLDIGRGYRRSGNVQAANYLMNLASRYRQQGAAGSTRFPTDG